MKKILVTAFGDFLHYDVNPTKEFLGELPDKKNLIKRVLPVGYFKKDFLRPIKRYRPDKIIFLGMNPSAKKLKFETVINNEVITLKNSILRFAFSAYSHWLKWNNKNLRIKNPPKKERFEKLFKTKKIEKKFAEKIKLKVKLPTSKEFEISANAGNYVCNYAMWVAQRYLQRKKRKTEFYFIHTPEKLTLKQKQELKKFILE